MPNGEVEYRNVIQSGRTIYSRLTPFTSTECFFKTVIFLLTVLMTTKHGIEDESVRDSAIHLCRTIFTDSEGDEDDEAGGGTATDMAKMLFDDFPVDPNDPNASTSNLKEFLDIQSPPARS